MALSKIDIENMITGEVNVANGGTGLSSGTSGQFLKFTDSTTLASAADNAGKLGQVVSDVSTSKYSTNSTSYASIFTPSTITPSATTSKILVSWYCSMAVLSNTSNLGHIAVQREIGGSDYAYVNSASGHNSSMYTFKADANQQGYGLSFEFLDSPNTTSAVRYYVQHKVDNSGVTLYLNQNQGGQGGHMFMNQKEILA
tara:strand:+ start:27 stop:623 length:597 start_codon:yes stop_codon:yes gene_type:complete